MTSVANDEILFRSVSLERKQCVLDENGSWRLSSQAFSDRTMKPSVDRSLLCNADPSYAQKSPKDGVVSVIAIEVREIKNFPRKDEKGKDLINEVGVVLNHAFDVVPDPITTPPENLAHALIITSPDYSSPNAFKRLLERLTRIAEKRDWLIKPQA